MKKTIIVAEDDAAISEVMKMEIVNRGYNCVTTKKAKKILPLISIYQPNLLVLDIMFPDGNGIEIARTIKKRRYKFPVIISSALPGAFNLVNKQIANYFLEKPFDINTFMNVVERGLTGSLGYNQNLSHYGSVLS